MSKTLFSILMLCIHVATFAQIKIPALSPAVEISQKIGLTKATLAYSRPSLRGRELFGEKGILIQGQKWRSGANATTTIEFSNDVELDGKSLPKGKYALLSTPQKSSWILHFYPYEKLPYTKFIEKEPILEITIPTKKEKYSLETFSLHFEAITLNTANLVLQWAEYKVEVPVKLNEHEAILTNIDKVLKGPSNFNYFQAALYLHETKTDLPLALNYIQKVTQSKSARFFEVFREALILKDLNKKTEAIASAKRCKELSEKAGNKDLVRLSQKIIDDMSK